MPLTDQITRTRSLVKGSALTPAPQRIPIGSIVFYLGNRANVTGYAANGNAEIRMLNTGSELSVPLDKLTSLTPAVAERRFPRAVLFAGAGFVAVIALVFLLDPDSKPSSEAAPAAPQESSAPTAPLSPSEVAPPTAAPPRSSTGSAPTVTPSYGAGVPAWVERLQDVKAAYIQAGNPEEADSADRRDSVVIEFTTGDAGQHCIAMRALAGPKHGVIAFTPFGMAVDSNDCLSVKLGAS
ncbi:hypothetical protein [Streptomyces sp. cg36]|uniref:hypothetical protein n=1 Tax=Streptomyces sp. cg36 TaxID=3238798 RepID=UPI0034E2E308